MTQIKLVQDGCLTKVVVNGVTRAYEPRISEIKNVSSGRWEGLAGGEPFEIIGGRASGGASNEWFVKWAPGYGDQYIQATSAAECVRLIENA